MVKQLPTGSEVTVTPTYGHPGNCSHCDKLTGTIHLLIKPKDIIDDNTIQYRNRITGKIGKMTFIDSTCFDINHETIHLVCLNLGENAYFDSILRIIITKEPICGL